MRVYEVATFYTMYNRSPVGRFHLQVCTTVRIPLFLQLIPAAKKYKVALSPPCIFRLSPQDPLLTIFRHPANLVAAAPTP